MQKKVTQVDRILKILEMLNEGREICLTQNPLSKKIALLEDMKKSSYKFEHLEVGLRALQKDMAYIKEYLGDNLSKKGSCYRLVKKEYLESFFKDNHKEIKKFFHAISLIDKSVFGENFKKYAPLLNSIKEQQKGVYLFLENPFENLKQLNLKEKLEEYIQIRRYINIYYYSDKEYKFNRVQAYKIIYHSGNWYLAVLTTKNHEINGGFKLLRLNFITRITTSQYSPLNFHEDIKVKDFLDNKLQSLFSSFNRDYFIVKVRINQEVSRHFQNKQFLKSQRIIGKVKGDLLVEFTINDEMEIIPMVQKWLPHIQILEPKHLQDKVLNNISYYIKGVF